MFIVLLKMSENRAQAAEYMDAHNAWIAKGFSDNVFLVVGGLNPGPGGGVMANNTSLEELQQRVDEDPFVKHKVVDVEILEISPVKTDERLNFLLA